MVIASIELQKALFSLLSTGYSVYEVVPNNPVFPYITIKSNSKYDANTKTETRTEHMIYIHSWSKGNSSLESKQMNAFIHDKLTNDFNVNGFHVDLVSLELEANQEEQKSDTTVFHGTQQFQITLTKQ